MEANGGIALPQPEQPNRRSIRLRDYDYSGLGAYFITICTKDRKCFLGEVIKNAVVLSRSGMIVTDVWQQKMSQFATVSLDAFTIMPNHVHAVVFITTNGANEYVGSEAGAMNRAPTIGQIVRSLKASSARMIRSRVDRAFAWQRNYYEHVIRNERSLNLIRRYIEANPVLWELDNDNPAKLRYDSSAVLQSVYARHGLTPDDWAFGVRHRFV